MDVKPGDPVPTGPSAEPAPRKKRRRRWKRYVCLGVVLVLLAGEIGLRMLADHNSRFNIFMGTGKEWDPELKFRLIRNYDGGRYKINSKGILGPEFDAAKRPGSFRIVTLGDSCSFTPVEYTYPQALEEELRRLLPERDMEIINASCPGYDSRQARTWYEREIDGYDHDMLLIYLGWNDMGQYNPDGLVYKLDESGYLEQPSLIQRAILHCYLLRSLYVVQGYWQRSRPFDAGPLTDAEAKPYRDFYPDHFQENLIAVIRLAQSRGRSVRLLNFAGIVRESPTADEQRRMHFPRGMGRRLQKYLLLIHAYDSALLKVAAETGTPILDIASLFDDPEKRRVFTDSLHFTAEGSAVIARYIAETLKTDIK